MGFGVWGLEFGVWGLGFGVWGLGFGVWGLGFGVWGFAFRVYGLGFRIKPGVLSRVAGWLQLYVAQLACNPISKRLTIQTKP